MVSPTIDEFMCFVFWHTNHLLPLHYFFIEVSSASSRAPRLYIRDLEEEDESLEMLEMFMSNPKRSHGTEISSWSAKTNSSGLYDVQIAYKDPEGSVY